jgi:hypothetical protein
VLDACFHGIAHFLSDPLMASGMRWHSTGRWSSQVAPGAVTFLN